MMLSGNECWVGSYTNVVSHSVPYFSASSSSMICTFCPLGVLMVMRCNPCYTRRAISYPFMTARLQKTPTFAFFTLAGVSSIYSDCDILGGKIAIPLVLVIGVRNCCRIPVVLCTARNIELSK